MATRFGDMAFTTPKDAFDALEHKVPVYMLSRANTKESVVSTDEINYHLFHKGIFGLKAGDKRLLEYLLALPENRANPFASQRHRSNRPTGSAWRKL